MSARGEAFFVMDLARELHKTKRELLKNVNSRDIEEWKAYFAEVNEKRPKKQSQAEIEGNLKSYFMMKTKGKKRA